MNAVRATWAICTVTFREILRDKVLYNVLMVSLLLLAIGFLASKLSFVRQDRVVTDFGLAAIQICGIALATLVGAALIGREYQRRTIYVALSRPISRVSFVAGKFLGLVLILWANWFLLCLSFAIILGRTGAEYQSELTRALVLAGVEAGLVGALAIFFSSFSTTSLSVIMTTGCILVGVNLSHVRFVANRVGSPVLKTLLELLAWALPNFERFHLGLKVTYGLPVANAYFFGAIAYGILASVFLVLAASFFVHRREA